MSSVKIQGSATGTANFTIAVPDGTSTDRTINLADEAGTFVTKDASNNISGVASVNGGQLGGFKNLLVNGNFSVSQRGTSFTTDNVYTIDRWYSGDGTGGSPARTLSQETFTLGQTDVPGAYYYLRHNQTGASTNGNASLVHKVEDVTRFDGQTVTFSFYAKADAAMDVEFRFTQDFGTGGSPSADVSLFETVTIGTTWQRYTITKTLGSLSGKTLGTDGVHTSFFRIIFEFQPTTTFTFDLAQCQLEYGSTATDFEHESVGTTLQKCQRYYYRIGSDLHFSNRTTSTAISDPPSMHPMSHPTTMRSTPSLTIASTASVGGTGWRSRIDETQWAYGRYQGGGTTSDTTVVLTAPIEFDAEL